MLSKTDLKLETEYSYKTQAEPNKVRFLKSNPGVFLTLNTEIEVFDSGRTSENANDMTEEQTIPNAVPLGNEPAHREVQNKKPSMVLKGAECEGWGLDSSLSERLVASGCYGGKLRLWDVGKEGS